MPTETHELSMAERSALLEEYATAVREHEPLETEYQDFISSGEDLKTRRDESMAHIKEIVERLGDDPLNITKAARKPRGPVTRDPARKQAVIDAMSEPRTASELAEITGLDKAYVTGVITNERKAGRVEAQGEKGSYKYMFTGNGASA